jgi:hypothetical protein
MIGIVIDEKFIDDICEGLSMLLDTFERKRGKKIRASTARKIVKDLLRTSPEVVTPLLDKYN